MENTTELKFMTTETSGTSESQTVFNNFTTVNNSTEDYLSTAISDRSDSSDQTSSYWIVETVLYAVIGVIGILGNGFTILIMLKSKKMRSQTVNKFLINQSAIDFLASFFLLATCNARYDRKIHFGLSGSLLCKFWTSKSLIWSLMQSSTANLLVINLERYLSIAHPILHKTSLTKAKMCVVMSSCWLIGFVYSMPPITLTTVAAANGKCLGFASWPSQDVAKFFGILNVVMKYFVPITIIGFTYLGMVHAMRKRSKILGTGILGTNVQETGGRTVQNSGAESTAQNLHPRRAWESSHHPGEASTSSSVNVISAAANYKIQTEMKIRNNILKTLAVVSLAFAICLGPNQFFFFVRNLGVPLAFHTPFHHFSVYMTFLNCVINPFIYAAQYAEFRKQAARLVRRARHKAGGPHGTASSYVGGSRSFSQRY